ncbi:MAG: PKD domain-containing protein [Candidatus Yanofskybacteria bacterium]|nr:PKD domain-containing protein [Candidatus Yanofskybacteria bacterium]
MRKFVFLTFGLLLFTSFVFHVNDLSATTAGPSFGSFRCDNQNDVKDCYFSVPSPDSNYQAYQATVSSLVDEIFTSDNSSILVEVCIAQSNSWPGSNPLGCWTPILESFAQPPPPRSFFGTAGPAGNGNPSNPGNWANIHIRIKDAYSNTNVAVLGRRVSVDDFSATPSTIDAGQSTTLSWTTDWAESVSIDNGVGSFPGGFGTTTGSSVVTPGITTTYTVSATGPGGFNGAFTDTRDTTVTVNNPTHLACVSNTCAVVDGAGADLDGCTTAGASCGGGGGRYKCTGSGDGCAWDPNDSGPNQCSPPNDSVCIPPPSCGNGQIDNGEQCDGGNLNSQTCSSLGFSGGGALSCNANCTFNTSACVTVGPGPGTGTVRIIANANDGYFVDGPGGDDWGWNGSADFPGHPTGTYSVSAPGGSSSPASQTLNAGATITFTVTFGGAPPPPPPPPPPLAGICGDTICDGGETCSTCGYDCGVCPAPGVTVDLLVSLNQLPFNYTNGPLTINLGQSVHLYFSSNNADSCVADWVGAVPTIWENTQQPSSTTTYGVRCTGPGGSATDSVTVIVSQPPNNPSNVTVTEPNYCVSGPAATIGWTYSDPQGSPQSAYQVQIDDQGSFNSPEVDSGKINSGSGSYFTGQGLLAFNTTYRARVRVWNGYDSVSGWTTSSSFKTPNFAYPQVNFTWTSNGISENPSPPIGKDVQFTDQTAFSGPVPNREWSWTFGDGGSSTQQNPLKVYNAEGTYYVTLTATDNADQSCARTRGPLIIQKPIPRWREVAPQ